MGFWESTLSFVSAVPIVGHVTAGVQYLAGDEEGAQKSLASSTGNLVGTAGAVGGFMVGGPVGAVAGGAAGAAVGGQIGRKINGQDFDLSIKILAIDATLGATTLGGGDSETATAIGKAIH